MRGELGRCPSFPSTRSTSLDRWAIETAKALGGLDVRLLTAANGTNGKYCDVRFAAALGPDEDIGNVNDPERTSAAEWPVSAGTPDWGMGRTGNSLIRSEQFRSVYKTRRRSYGRLRMR
jgi:hypothetical protein